MITTETNATAAEQLAEVAGLVGEATSREEQLREEIAGVLDGIKGLRKVQALTAEARTVAEAPLLDALREAVAALDQPVARGNTVYLVAGGRLVVVDLTPGVLARV